MIEINVPQVIESPYGNVTVTALDANHCPGSCMCVDALLRLETRD